MTRWHENGQKWIEQNRRDNGIIWILYWYENGQKELERNWKDGKVLSIESWKPNGEKCPITNLKDGNGIVVLYDNDGKEIGRGSYENGRRKVKD